MDRPFANNRPFGPLLGNQEYSELGESQFDELQQDQERVKELTLRAHQQIDGLSQMSMQDLFTDKENTLMDLLFTSAVHGECNTLVTIPNKLLPSLASNVERYADTVASVNDSVRVAENSAAATFPLNDYVQAIAVETGCRELYENRVLPNSASIEFTSLDGWRNHYDNFSMDDFQ
jgi:predicted ATP-grasp superfamily ATP-dependent carboligase